MFKRIRKFMLTPQAFRAYAVLAFVGVLEYFGMNGAFGLIAFAGTGAAGRVLTTDIREHEDLSDVIDILMLKDPDMRMLSFANFIPNNLKVIAKKHEWLDDEARGESVSLTATGDGNTWDTTNIIADLPCTAANCDKLRVGDLLLLPGGDEVVRVSVIDRSAETINLTARGHGSSTATVQGHAAFTAYVIGNAQDEDSDPIEANSVVPGEKFNYCQTFEDVASVSGSIRRSKTVAGDWHDYQVIKKLKEVLKCFNYALLEGLKDLSSGVGTMGGVREFFSTTYNINGALTEAKLYAIAEAIMNAGGVPTQIHGSIGSISAIEQLYTGSVRYESSQNRVGLSVKKIEMMGLELELYPDRHVRTAEIIMLDRNRVKYGPLAGGKYEDGRFQTYPLFDKRNGKQHATQILGEMVVKVSNAAAAGCRGYGRT